MFTNRFEQFIHLYWVLRAHVSWRGARNGPTQFEIQVSAAQNTDMKGKHRKKYDFLKKITYGIRARTRGYFRRDCESNLHATTTLRVSLVYDDPQ